MTARFGSFADLRQIWRKTLAYYFFLILWAPLQQHQAALNTGQLVTQCFQT